MPIRPAHAAATTLRVAQPLWLACLLAGLASCTTIVEHARVEVLDDATTTLQVLVSGKDKSDGDSGDADKLKDYAAKAKECGANTRSYGPNDKGRVFVQTSYVVKSKDELDTVAACAALTQANPVLTLSTRDSVFSTEYRLELGLNINIDAMIQDGVSAPNELLVTMPGKIVDVADTTTLQFHRKTLSRVGDNRVRVDLQAPTLDLEAMFKVVTLEFCPAGSPKACESTHKHDIERKLMAQRVQLTVVSERSKLDLQTTFAGLGVLMGSSLLLELGRHFAGRLRASKPAPRTGRDNRRR